MIDEGERDWSLRTTANARFGDERWLPAMLAPLNKELTRVFIHQDHDAIARGAPPRPLRDRARYALAIGELAKFFRAAGFHNLVVGNFIELAAALYELDEGVVRPFLKPTKAANRHRDPGDVWVIRAHIAIALDVVANDPLVKLGEAAKRIERDFGFFADIASPKSKDFAGAMLKWRKQFLNRQVLDDGAQSSFDNRVKLIEVIGRDMIARGEPISFASLSDRILKDATLLVATAMTSLSEKTRKKLKQKRK